ncbi:MAG: hypothetical protein GY832_23020 [Chloroflexi bacterium]|nr:hypothetical protein [Chloroflexota bacterium]
MEEPSATKPAPQSLPGCRENPRNVAIALWIVALVFAVTPFMLIPDQVLITDAVWAIALPGTVSIFLVITGIGVWRSSRWGMVLLALVPFTGLVFLLVKDVRDGDILGFIIHTAVLIAFAPRALDLWKS